jgi:hypothetical protein
MDISDQAHSQHWSLLTSKGQKIADVWSNPEGEPLALEFRIPQSSFQVPRLAQRLTIRKLLKSLAIATDRVESWRHGDSTYFAQNGLNPELKHPLPPPPDDADHLEIRVHLKPEAQAVADETTSEPEVTSRDPEVISSESELTSNKQQVTSGEEEDSEPKVESSEPEVAPAEWQDLEACWKAILALEASVDLSRKNLECTRTELQASMRMNLSVEEKANALSADVAQWNTAKNRAHYVLPKVNEFIHRATWTEGTPERKKLAELFANPIDTQTSLPDKDEVQKELEILRKDRQVLSTHGMAVQQECKSVIADMQSALRRLQSNAATRAAQKKGGTVTKNKLI